MPSITRTLLATSFAERRWCEDQITVILFARGLMCGNSRVLVVETDSGGAVGYTVGDFPNLEEVRSVVAECGWRLIEGSALFTARDNPRPYEAPKPNPTQP